MARFQAGKPSGTAVAELELLVRTAIFKPATAMVGYLLQAAADQIDEAYKGGPRCSATCPGEKYSAPL